MTWPILPWRGCYLDRTYAHGYSVRLELDCGSNFTVPTPLAAITYCSSHRIMTWSISTFCSSRRSFTSRFPIYDPTDIRWVAAKKGHILSEMSGFLVVTQRILVRWHIWDWEVKERLELHNQRTNHVMIRSALKYLITGKVVMLKCRVFGGGTGPFPMGPVFRVVRPVAMVQFRVKQKPEPTREFWPVANPRDMDIFTIITNTQLWFTGQILVDIVYHQFFFIINRLGHQPTAMQYYKSITPQMLGLVVVAVHCIQSGYSTR